MRQSSYGRTNLELLLLAQPLHIEIILGDARAVGEVAIVTGRRVALQPIALGFDTDALGEDGHDRRADVTGEGGDWRCDEEDCRRSTRIAAKDN